MSNSINNNTGNWNSPSQSRESADPFAKEALQLTEQMHQANKFLKKMGNVSEFSNNKVRELIQRHENGKILPAHEPIAQNISILKNMQGLAEKVKCFENKEISQPFPYNYCATVGKNVTKLWMNYNASWLGVDQEAYKAQLQECKSDLAQARHMMNQGLKMHERREERIRNSLEIAEAFHNEDTSNTKQKVCIIPGGTGHLGSEVILKALAQGYKVIVTSRNPDEYKKKVEGVEYIKVPSEEQCSPEFWKDLMGKYGDDNYSVRVVNAIGSPVAPKGKELRDVNVLPAVAIATAMKQMQDGGEMEDGKLIHLSSMGAIMLKEDAYAAAKKEAEDAIEKVGLKNLCILRVGYAFQRAVEGEIIKIDNTHAYGMEQMAALPLHFIIGSGKQLLQPVFAEDIADAGLNFKGGTLKVNAIGKEVLSQENCLRYYCDLAGKPFRPVHVSCELASLGADFAPKGHFAGYAVEGCRILENEDMIYSAEDFEALMGHETSSLGDVYDHLKGQKIYYPMPPIREHAHEAAANACAVIKDAKNSAINTVKNNGLSQTSSAARTIIEGRGDLNNL
jgi:uncharacterized protein YbjT (DUF2867 family)